MELQLGVVRGIETLQRLVEPHSPPTVGPKEKYKIHTEDFGESLGEISHSRQQSML